MRAVNQPQSWWGWHGWNQPEPLSIVEILRAGTMPSRLAAAFWLGMERGASFAFAAEPPGSGKTTVLTALFAFARDDTVAYFTRGWGETFDLPSLSDAYPTYMMVNEISDHLPVYSWGPYVLRIFELLTEGYSVCTTMHADTVEEVIDQLEGEGVSRSHLAELTFVVPLVLAYRDGRTLHRVREVGLLGPGNGDLAVTRVCEWDERSDAFSILEGKAVVDAVAVRLGLDPAAFDRELQRREAFLDRLVADGVAAIDAVQDAVDNFNRESADEA